MNLLPISGSSSRSSGCPSTATNGEYSPNPALSGGHSGSEARLRSPSRLGERIQNFSLQTFQKTPHNSQEYSPPKHLKNKFNKRRREEQDPMTALAPSILGKNHMRNDERAEHLPKAKRRRGGLEPGADLEALLREFRMNIQVDNPREEK